MSIYGIGKSAPEVTLEPIATIDEDVILKSPVIVDTKTGVLSGVTPTVKKAVIDLTTPSIVQQSFPPIVRPSGISDQAWSEMQAQGQAKIADQQKALADAKTNVQVVQAISSQDKQTAALSGTDAIASVQYATDLSKVIASGKVNSDAALEIASQVVRASVSSQAAASLPTASEDDKKAAQVCEIISSQAVSDALKLKAAEVSVKRDETEQTAAGLIAKVQQTNLQSDLVAANQAQTRLDEINNVSMTTINDSLQAKAEADGVKAKAESDAANIAWKLLHPDILPTIEKAQYTFFEKVINYVYNTIYS